MMGEGSIPLAATTRSLARIRPPLQLYQPCRGALYECTVTVPVSTEPAGGISTQRPSAGAAAVCTTRWLGQCFRVAPAQGPLAGRTRRWVLAAVAGFKLPAVPAVASGAGFKLPAAP